MPTTPLRSHETEDVRPERRAAETLLEQGDLEGARQRLEAYLANEPDDARARGLLGLCCFRLGRLDEAARLYAALVERNPGDATLRVNLGLVALKRGDAAEAAAQFEVAVSLAPTHRKALNYLGLALAQRGELALARDAFERAGATAMAERMAAQLAAQQAAAQQAAQAEQPAAAPAAEPAAPVLRHLQGGEAQPPAEAPADADGTEETSFADIAPADETNTPAAAPAPVQEPPVAHLPVARLEEELPARPAAEPSAPRIATFAAERALRWPEGRPFAVADDAAAITFATEVRTRLDGLVAAHGVAAWTPVQKRFRGEEIDRLFGTGAQQMWRATGGGRLLFHTRGRCFTALYLDAESYLVEERVFAFDESIRWENGRLPGQATDLHLVRFTGAGHVLLTSERPVRVERVEGDTLSLPITGLVGWTGPLAPRLVGAEEGPAVPWIELSGSGTVLLLG